MKLAQLEARFWQAVRSKAPPAWLDEVFVANNGLDVVRSMGIYHAQYWARQVRALEQVFPRVLAHLDEARFRQLALAYIDEFPSETPVIERIGRGLADYMHRRSEEFEPRLVDLARLEWARLEVLLAPDSAPFELGALGRVDLARARAKLAAHVRCLELSELSLASWRGVVSNEDASRERTTCVIWRQRYVVNHIGLEPAAAVAFERLTEGDTLAARIRRLHGRACRAHCGADAAELDNARLDRGAPRMIDAVPARCRALLLGLCTLCGACSGDSDDAYGFETGPLMLPGDDCTRCHRTGSEFERAPHWTVAGTIYAAADAPADQGLAGVRVSLSDEAGTLLLALTTNAAGNFYTAQTLPEGYRVALEYQGLEIAMPCPPPSGGCAKCHSLPPIGFAPGRLYAPSQEQTVPSMFDCEAWMPH